MLPSETHLFCVNVLSRDPILFVIKDQFLLCFKANEQRELKNVAHFYNKLEEKNPAVHCSSNNQNNHIMKTFSQAAELMTILVILEMFQL